MDNNIYIKCPNGDITKIDKDDKDLENVKWYSQKKYIVRKGKDRKYIYMHRVILERKIGRKLLKNEEVDHIDKNRLNNTRSNLRVASRNENCMNISKIIKSKTSSIYKGVNFDKIKNMYRTRITYLGETIHIGYFDTEINAAIAYDKAARKYFGEYAVLNFG